MSDLRTGTNPVEIENIDPRTLLRLKRMARELRLTDQMLSWDIDNLSITDAGSAPAWTAPDGASITINAKLMPSTMTRKGVAVWLGTNAHEIFHSLFSPRSKSRLMLRVYAAERSTDRGIHRSWNVLEDQRIERLGLHRFGAWRGYLIAALAHHIPVAHPQAWVLIAGRTWLSSEVRAIARASFVATNDEGSARLAAQLIGAYQSLADPGDTDADEAYRIVAEFHDAFGSAIPPKGGCGNKPQEGGEPEDGDDGTVSDSFPTADEADDDESGDGDDDEGDDEGDESDDESEGDGDESDDEGDGEGDDADDEGDDGEDDFDGGDGDDDDASPDDEGDEADDEGDGEGDSEDGDDEADDDGDADGETDGEGEADADMDEPGDGIGKPGDEPRTMDEAMDDEVNDSLNDEETRDDLDRVVDQVDHGTTGGGDLPRSAGEWEEVPDTAKSLAREVSDVLSAIRDDNEAAWIRRTDTGRFNVGRWATDPTWDADDIFDEFQAGAMDASSLDCVLVLDVSGSMSDEAHQLAEATWAIRTAIDRIEGQCTVLGFGAISTLIFDGGQRPDGRIFLPHLEDSTDATGALREAHRLVADSAAANRIVIVLTDGSWWNPKPALAALQACQASGATTCVVELGMTYSRYGGTRDYPGADLIGSIKASSELVPIFRELAERSMLASSRRAG